MRTKPSSVLFMGLSFLSGIIAVLTMFLPFMSESGTDFNASYYFWGDPITKGAWTTFVGYMLIFGAAIVTGVIALPFIQPRAKTEKIVLISCIAAVVLGIALVSLTQVHYSAMNNNAVGYQLDDLTFLAGFYVSMSFALIAAGLNVVALKLDW